MNWDGGIAPRISDLSTRRRWMVSSFTPRGKRRRYWVGPKAGLDTEGIETAKPDRLACSHSQYRPYVLHISTHHLIALNSDHPNICRGVHVIKLITCYQQNEGPGASGSSVVMHTTHPSACKPAE